MLFFFGGVGGGLGLEVATIWLPKCNMKKINKQKRCGGALVSKAIFRRDLFLYQKSKKGGVQAILDTLGP